MVYWRILCHEKWKTSPLTWYGVDLIGYVNMHGSLAYFPFFCSNSIGAIILSIFKQSHYRWETLFVMHHAWEDIWRKEHFWKCLHRVLHSRKLFDKFEASFPGSREKRAGESARATTDNFKVHPNCESQNSLFSVGTSNWSSSSYL